MSLTPKEAGAGGAAKVFPHDIPYSALFDGVDDHLSFTPTTTGDQTRMTIHLPLKICHVGTDPQYIFESHVGGNAASSMFFSVYPNGSALFGWYDGSAYVVNCYASDHVFKDSTGWGYLTIAINTNLSSGQLKAWWNDRLVTFDGVVAPVGSKLPVNTEGNPMHFGRAGSGSYPSNSYFGPPVILDGQALDYSTFIEPSDRVTGLWVPKEVVIPTATKPSSSTIFTGGTVTAEDSFGAGYTPELAFSPSTTWGSGCWVVANDASRTEGWIQYDLGVGNETDLKQYVVHSREGMQTIHNPTLCTLRGSDNGTDWTEVDSWTVGPWYGTQTRNLSGGTPYRCYRWEFSGSSDIMGIGYIEGFSSVEFTYGANGCHLDFADAMNLGNDVALPPTEPVVGAANALTGGTAYGPSSYGFVPANLFDSNNGNPRWDADSAIGTGCYAAYQLPAAKTIGAYLVRTYDGSGATAWAYGWDILGSNDSTNGVDGTWDVLDSVRNQTQMGAYGASYNGTIDFPGEYVWYKWVFQEGNYSYVNSLGTWHAYELESYASLNSWTVHGSPVQTVDTPTDNHCTWNPLVAASSAISFANGNLALSGGSSSLSSRWVAGTKAVATGKWYWETRALTQTNFNGIGVAKADEEGVARYCWDSQSNTTVGGMAGTLSAAAAANDIIGVAWDVEAGTVEYFQNNVSLGVLSGFPIEGLLVPYAEVSTGQGQETDFGQLGFTYAPPSGFKALSSANLPDPTVMKSASAAQVVLREGMGGEFGAASSGASATASRDNGAHSPAQMVDRNNATVWYSGYSGTPFSDSNPVYVTHFLSVPRRIVRFGMTVGWSTGAYTSTCPTDYTVEVGDGTNWTPIKTVAGQPNRNDAVVTYAYGADQAVVGDRIRYRITGWGGNTHPSGGVSIYELYAHAGSAIELPEMKGGPDMTVVKARDAATWWIVNDRERGDNQQLFFNDASAQVSSPSHVSFLSDRYEIGSDGNVNTLNGSFVDLALKVGAEQGFEIQTYTGTGLFRAFAHSLGKAPTWIMVKRIDAAGDWLVCPTLAPHGGAGVLRLNATDVYIQDAYAFGGANPTAAHWYVGASNGADTNVLNGVYIAYLFTDSDIFKAFSYTGSGSADGPFVNLGGRPLSIPFLKNTNAATNWLNLDMLRNPTNPISAILSPNNADADSALYNWLNVTSTGFKVTEDADPPNANGSGNLIVGLAILESTKYSNAF